MNENTSNLEDRRKAAVGLSTINTVVGLWLILSTFVLTAFSNLYSARWNNVIVGILVALFSIVRASGDQRACWSWSNLVLGVWLIISPFVLGFSHLAAALWHNVIAGVIIALVAWSRALSPSSVPTHVI